MQLMPFINFLNISVIKRLNCTKKYQTATIYAILFFKKGQTVEDGQHYEN